jgi:hypothetical protein
MSTIAAILTLFPLATAYNRGAQMHQPLAIAIIARAWREHSTAAPGHAGGDW